MPTDISVDVFPNIRKLGNGMCDYLFFVPLIGCKKKPNSINILQSSNMKVYLCKVCESYFS